MQVGWRCLPPQWSSYPSIGPGISGAIGTVVALFQGSTWMPISNIAFALIVLVIYIIITQIETLYLIPRLVGGKVQLHPAVTFVGIISGTIVFGLLGVLLATPIIASARTLLTYTYRKLRDQDPFEELTPPQDAVRIPGLIAGRKIDAVIFDLDGTLAQVDLDSHRLGSRTFRLAEPPDRPNTAQPCRTSRYDRDGRHDQFLHQPGTSSQHKARPGSHAPVPEYHARLSACR